MLLLPFSSRPESHATTLAREYKIVRPARVLGGPERETCHLCNVRTEIHNSAASSTGSKYSCLRSATGDGVATFCVRFMRCLSSIRYILKDNFPKITIN